MSKFCNGCGKPLKVNAKFCTGCGNTIGGELNASAPIPPTQQSDTSGYAEVLVPVYKRPLVIAGAVAALLVVVIASVMIFAKPKSESDFGSAANEVPSNAADATTASINGQEASFFSTNAETNVRDGPTTDGTNVIRKLIRGEKVTGIVQLGGMDGVSPWLKLTDSSGYVSMVNLTASEPPALTLVRDTKNGNWNVEADTDLLIAPDPNSATVARLKNREKVVVAGVTANGYAEVLRTKGGVGYFLVTDSNDRGGELHATQSTGKESIWQSMQIGANGRYFSGNASDQDIAISLLPPPSGLADGQVTYKNTVTKKTCGSGLRYIGPSGDGFLFKQGPSVVGEITCGVLLDIVITGGMEGAISASWMQNGRTVMGPVQLDEEGQ